VVSEKHNIAIAFSGTGIAGTEPASELGKLISAESTLPDVFGAALIEWGKELYKKMYGADAPQRERPTCKMLVVNPEGIDSRFWRLGLNRDPEVKPDIAGYMINGDESNPANFWPEYFKAEKKDQLDLDSATGVAVTTILTGGRINPYAVYGLEIYQYNKQWNALSQKQIESICDRFDVIDKNFTKEIFKVSSSL
jgi:hypothetical protein